MNLEIVEDSPKARRDRSAEARITGEGRPQWAYRGRTPTAIRPARQVGLCSLAFAEHVPDKNPSPLEQLVMVEAWDESRQAPVIDPETGKPVMEPLRLFSGDVEGAGWTVPIDPRLATKGNGKAHHSLVAAARRSVSKGGARR